MRQPTSPDGRRGDGPAGGSPPTDAAAGADDDAVPFGAPGAARVGPGDPVATAYAAHAAAVNKLRQDLASLPAGAPIRLAKTTSNLFRFGTAPRRSGLDVSAFDRVLAVDPVTRTADVAGMVTYERLVDETLKFGLMPMVVPQLKTITLGGAVVGLGIESTSFRAGLPHESVLELEIARADGQVVVARADNEHARLFAAFPNSYGTLGYALRIKIELVPVAAYVRLRHLRFADAASCFAAIERICATGDHDGESVDFIDGVVFGPSEHYLSLGSWAELAPWRSDYTGMKIFYQSIRQRETDYLTAADYLWRWDTDWFWCSRAFGVQNPVVRRLWPRRWRRSDVYRRLVALDRRYRVSDRVLGALGRPAEEPVVQDVEIPVEQGPAFLDFFHSQIGISPIWLCPIRLRGPRGWPLYPLAPGKLYVNFGFWSSVARSADLPEGHYNRVIEERVDALGGHKSLYSTVHYDEAEFWRRYNGDEYRVVKQECDPAGRLPNLYQKCVGVRS